METFDKNNYLLQFGERIRQLRTARGMTQDELAARAGYTSRSTISKIEKGKADVPRSQIVLLANALGVDPVTLTIDAQPSDEDIALAQRIARLDSYRRALIESILNTEPEK